MTELDLTTTDELVDELMRRHPDGVVVGLSRDNESVIEFEGDIDVTLRLVQLLMWDHQKRYEEDED